MSGGPLRGRRGPPYDRTNQTYVFTTSPIYVSLPRFLDLSDRPSAARNYFTVKAERKFQDRVQGERPDHFAGHRPGRARRPRSNAPARAAPSR